MSLRKLRRANRGLLSIVGTPNDGTLCVDCRDHLARVKIMRRAHRDGSSYAIKSQTLLHLCETCAIAFVEQIIGMLGHMTRNRVDAELSHTTAARAQIAKSTGSAARHDRHVRARIKRLKRDDAQNLPTARRA